jgi:hypothetical protein
MPNKQHLFITQGDRRTLLFTFTSPDGSAANLGGAVVTFTVKKSAEQLDAAADIQISSSDVGNPKGSITITGAMTATLVLLPVATASLTTGRYYYDCQALYSAEDISTAVEGEFHISKQITRKATA